MKRTRRAVGMILAVAMMTPCVAGVADAAVATWLSPQPGQRITSRNVDVSVGYNTQSDLQITRLELWVDGQLNARKHLVRGETRGVCSFLWDTSRYSDGPHELIVKVYSGDKLISTVSSTGTVGNMPFDVMPPVVSFSGIKAGDVLKGNANIKINAKDDSGKAPLVSLLVDDSLKLVTNKPPYAYRLDTTSYQDGGHQLETYAYDAAGNKSDPAVIKVSFKNNAQRPVVTSLNIAPSKEIAASEDDGTAKIEAAPVAPKVTPKVAPIEAKPVAPQAARTNVLPTLKATTTRPIAAAAPSINAQRPTVSLTLPAAKTPAKAVELPVLPAAKAPVKVAEVPVTPVKVAPKPVVIAPKKIAAASKPPVELAPIADIAVPTTKPTVVASAPSIRTNIASSVASKPKATAEPVREAPASVSTPKPVLMAKAPSLRSNELSALTSSQTTKAREVISDPVSASARPMTTSAPTAKLRAENQNALASEGKRVALAPSLPSAKKPVSVISVDDVNARAKAKGIVEKHVELKSDRKAKLEKKVLPVSGKVKLRDLINKEGGIVFWDAKTRTVTAYAGNIKLDLKVGSKIALVNGKEMQISHTPYVAKGRTIIDASVYHQALAFEKKHNQQASAK